MREIKFRGKSVTAGDFIYGDFLQINNKTYIYPDIHGDLDDIDFGHTYIEVIPETVGQFTGLHDKNGKEIYEGDIVKFYFGYYMNPPTEMIDDVRFINGCFYFFDNDVQRGSLIHRYNEICEVIGNIHENQ